MAMYRSVLLIILGVLPVTYACVTLEEGRNGYVMCGSANVRKNISFQLEMDDQLVNVSTCSVFGTCENFMPDLFKSSLVKSGFRKSNRLDILRVSKYYTKFRCRKDGELVASCTLDVFVSPAKPTCSTPVVDMAKNEVSLTCRTETVYPDVECSFFHRGDRKPQKLYGIGSIKYSLTPSKVSPGNMAAECTIVLNRWSLLARSSYQFKVSMRAKPKDDRKKAYDVESDYTCPFYPDPSKAPQVTSLLCPSKPDVDAPTTFATQVCVTIEVGKNVFLNCGTSRRSVDSTIRFDLWENGAFTNLSSCSIQQRTCEDYLPNNYVSEMQWESSKVKNHMRILKLDRNQTIFKCAIDNRISGICEVESFVNPSKPTCDTPRLVQNNTKISVTCRTLQVYPRARCNFRMRTQGDTDTPRYRGIDYEEISYLEFPSRVSPGDKQTECTALFPARYAVLKPVHFQVEMTADVSGGSPATVYSEFTPGFMIEQPSNSATSYFKFAVYKTIIVFLGLKLKWEYLMM